MLNYGQQTEMTLYSVINSISGIWNSYGCVPESGESISISIEDTSGAEFSLIDLCGFQRESKDIGKIASSKDIRELVVMLPMLRYKDYSEFIYYPPEKPEPSPTKDPCAPCDEDPCAPITYRATRYAKDPKLRDKTYFSAVEDAWLFTINEEMINKILGVPNYKELNIFKIKDIIYHKEDINLKNYIVKLMIQMVNYNFPPHLNWLLHKDIPPLVMYTAEFSARLYQEDLANIWQGSMPRHSEQVDDSETNIEHFLHEEELFGGLDLTYVLNTLNVQMKVFKVKYRANHSYYKDVVKDRQWVTPSYEENENINYVEKKWYNYNWPYDNFSLVELIKIEGGEVHDFIADKNPLVKDGGVLLTSTPRNPDSSGGVNTSGNASYFSPHPITNSRAIAYYAAANLPYRNEY